MCCPKNSCVRPSQLISLEIPTGQMVTLVHHGTPHPGRLASMDHDQWVSKVATSPPPSLGSPVWGGYQKAVPMCTNCLQHRHHPGGARSEERKPWPRREQSVYIILAALGGVRSRRTQKTWPMAGQKYYAKHVQGSIIHSMVI